MMHAKLASQMTTARLTPSVVNTTRVVREPPQFASKKHALEFAIGETLQNVFDHTEPLLACDDTLLIKDEEEATLSWKLEGRDCVSLRSLSDGIDIVQIGCPLSLDCIGTGTASKSAAGAGAGGFGDGSKTASHAYLFYDHEVTLLFYCFDEDDVDLVIVWRWVIEVFDGFSEPHMGVRVMTRRRFPYEQHYTIPTMMTCIRRHDNDQEALDLLRECFVRALSRFNVMYDEFPDHQNLTIKADGVGSWQRSCTFRPKMDSFLGHKIQLPAKANVSLVLANGIFYMVSGSYMPSNLVMRIFGKGIPGSPQQVFTSQMREISHTHLQAVFNAQFAAFVLIESNRDALVAAFKPLLKGGSSFVVHLYPNFLVNNLMYNYDSCKKLRELLLFWRLSPKEWSNGSTPTAKERRELENRVEHAVVCDAATAERVAYCEWLCGNVNNVVIVGSKANYQLFRPVTIDREQDKAAEAVLLDARGRKKLARPIDREMKPAIKYIGGPKQIEVIRVHTETPKDVEAFNFRNSSNDIIVYYQIKSDPEHTTNSIQPQMIANSEESDRAMRYAMQFFANDARRMALGRRVRYAIKNASEYAPYDLGSDGPKRKIKEESSESEEEEGEGEEDNEFEKLAKELMKRGENKTKKPKVQKQVSNVPAQKMPSVKTIQGGMVNGGGSSSRGPAPEPPEDKCPSMYWDENRSIFLAVGSPFEPPSNLPALLETFHRVLDFVREKINVRGTQVYPCYAPEVSWRGLFFPGTNVALINLYLRKTSAGMYCTIIHELAHIDSCFHDHDHGNGMMERVELTVAALLPF